MFNVVSLEEAHCNGKECLRTLLTTPNYTLVRQSDQHVLRLASGFKRAFDNTEIKVFIVVMYYILMSYVDEFIILVEDYITIFDGIHLNSSIKRGLYVLFCFIFVRFTIIYY